MSVRVVLGWATLAAAAIAAGLATVGCEEDEPRGTNVAATATPTAATVVPVGAGESAPVVEDVQSVCERADCWPPEDPLDTVEELVKEADLIAVVRAEREVESIHGVGGMVISRVELRVESAVAGDAAEGDAIVAHLPGGVSAVTGNPWIEGGFKPKPGEPTREERYAESPPFQIGKRELVFFKESEADDGSLRLYPMYEGRYRFVQGTLAPLFGEHHRFFERLAPKGIRDVLTGKTLTEFGALIAPILAAKEAAGPAPLKINGDGLVSTVRDRLATEPPHVAAVLNAVEAHDIAALSALTSFTPFECAPEPGLFVSCAEAGVAPGTVIDMRLLESEAGVFRDGGQRPYASRAEWEARLAALLDGTRPELVAVVEKTVGGSNLVYLAFRRDMRTGPVGAEQECFVLAIGLLSAEPVAYLHELPTCRTLVDEVRAFYERHDAMMEFWALATELRDS